MSQVEVDAGEGRFIVYATQPDLKQGWVSVMVKEKDDEYTHWPILVRGDGLMIGPEQITNLVGLSPVSRPELSFLDPQSQLFQLPPEVLVRLFNVSLFLHKSAR